MRKFRRRPRFHLRVRLSPHSLCSGRASEQGPSEGQVSGKPGVDPGLDLDECPVSGSLHADWDDGATKPVNNTGHDIPPMWTATFRPMRMIPFGFSSLFFRGVTELSRFL